jgi:predicted dienelactone hydrolase
MGSTGLGLGLMWLGNYLASHGYIVAAVNHHGNTAAEGRLLPQGFLLEWERPDDLTKGHSHQAAGRSRLW